MNHKNESNHEHRLIDLANRGDESAYRQLFEPYRREMLAYCYRMLGSGEDAEDALQETLLLAWRGLREFEGRSNLRTWLYKIATHTSLNLLAKRRRRMLSIDYGPPSTPEDPFSARLPGVVWIDPYPDGLLFEQDDLNRPEARYEHRESVELAFIAAFQLLTPFQRAVLILIQVLGFSAQETANMLGKSVASINSLLQRARLRIEQRRPELSQLATIRALEEEELQSIIKKYMDAMERADIHAILAMLTEDATWSMPPLTNWYDGLDAISSFLTKNTFTFRWRYIPTRANGQLAIGCYRWDPLENAFVANCLDVLTLRGKHIASVTAFLSIKHLQRLGLPEKL